MAPHQKNYDNARGCKFLSESAAAIGHKNKTCASLQNSFSSSFKGKLFLKFYWVVQKNLLVSRVIDPHHWPILNTQVLSEIEKLLIAHLNYIWMYAKHCDFEKKYLQRKVMSNYHFEALKLISWNSKFIR